MKTAKIPSAYQSFPEMADIYLAGYSRGWNAASWQDIPEIGSKLPRHIDYFGLGEIADATEQGFALQILASEAESNSRDYSPFEFTAKELNDREDSEDAWQAYDEGIADGINANIASRITLN